jgi:RHS repeat-associated protein
MRDHLGNNRIVVAINGNSHQAVQATDYDPFGMPFSNGVSPERQPYKFGGKELDEMHGLNWYDFGARAYDGILGRFPTTMDPLAEKYYSISPYAYCGNNPMNLIDPTGMDPQNPYSYNWNTGNYQDQNGNFVSWSVVHEWLLDVAKGFHSAYETIKSKLSSQPAAFKADIVTTLDFFTGAGPETRDFGWGTPSSESLKNSYMTTVALKKFMTYYKNNPSKSSWSDWIPFSPEKGSELGPVNLAKNDMGYSTAQFVGTCKYSFTIVGDHVNVTVFNTTSLWSTFYHLPFTGKPSREETPFGIGGNIDQTFRFSIPLDEARKRANQ